MNKNNLYNNFACLFFFAFALLLTNLTLTGQNASLEQHWWLPNGPVNAIVRDNDTVYIGGAFTNIGPNVPYGTLVHVQNAGPDLTYVNPNGRVNTAIPDGQGGWYIGGTFTRVGGQIRNRLARINSDGTLHPWNPNADNEVKSLLLDGGRVYIGGSFNAVGGKNHYGIAAIDTIYGLVLDWSALIDNSTSSPVNSISFTQNEILAAGNFTSAAIREPNGVAVRKTNGLPDVNYSNANGTIEVAIPDDQGGWYIGGRFTQVGGQSRNRLARINADGSLHPWNPNANNTVLSLLLSGNTVYIGGNFTSIHGQVRNRLAAVDKETGELTAWNPNVNNEVRTIQIEGETIYIGGDFTTVGGQSRAGLASINIHTGTPTGWGPQISSPSSYPVYSLLIGESEIYAGGNFTAMSVLEPYGAAVNKLTGFSEFNYLNPNGTIEVAVADGQGGWYIGGSFTQVGGQTRNRLAKLNYDGSLHSWNPDANNTILSIHLSGNLLYVGGRFTTIGGQSRNRLAVVDASTGVTLDWNPNVNNDVRSILSDNETIYIGGEFTSVGGQLRSGLAAINSQTGIPTEWSPHISSPSSYPVYGLALGTSEIYAGGSFTSVSVFEPKGTALNKNTGFSEFNYLNPNGTVETAISDGQGGWFIGGSFTEVGGQTRNRVARLNHDGTLHPWNPDANGTVHSLAKEGDVVYVGGDFTLFGGLSRNRLAAVDAEAATLTDWNPDVNNEVRCIVVEGSTVYIGGDFTNAGGQTRNKIAALDIASGIATNWNPNVNTSGNVYTLASHNDVIYVGGSFTSIGGQTRNRLAAIDKVTGLTTAWNPNANGTIYALLLDGDILYVGGSFSNIGGFARNRIAALNTQNNSATNWNPNASSSTIYALACDENNIYVGGSFTTIGGQSRNRVASLDKSTGQPTPFDPNVSGTIQTIAIQGDALYLGGDFSTIASQTRNRIAAFDKITGNASSWNPNAGGTVRKLLMDGDILYVGGSFSTIGGQSRNRVAALSTQNGTASSWNPNVSSSTVYAIETDQSNVYIGGTFSSVGGQTRNRVAVLDKITGSVTAINPNVNGTVLTLAVQENALFMGGSFSTIGGQTRNRLAAFDKITGVALPWNPNLNGNVRSLRQDGDILYIGGDFTTVGGQARNRIAAIEKLTGLPLAWNPNSNATIYSISVDGNTIYACGTFSSIGGQTRNRIAALDKVTGLSSSWNPNPNSTVRTMALQGDLIYFGGSFLTIGSQTRNRLVSFDKETGILTAWNPGANGEVNALVNEGNMIYVGGAFTSIGGKSRNRIASLNPQNNEATEWNPNAGSTVRSLLLDNDVIYAGGSFTTIGGQNRNRIAAIHTSSGSATSWNPNITGASSATVRSLVTDGTYIYAGGAFTSVGALTRNNIVAIDKATALATDWNPNALGAIYALSWYGNGIYTGGEYTTLGGVVRNRLLALDANTGQPTNWNPNANNTVNSLIKDGETIFVGGAFTQIGGETRNRIAAIQADNGNLLAWNPNANNTVLALAADDNHIYAGGTFTTMGGYTRNRLAALSKTTGEINQDWNPNAGAQVNTLALHNGALYVGGAFTTMGGQTRNRLAALDLQDGQILPLWVNHAGTTNTVNALVAKEDKLYIGGLFGTFNGVSRSRLAQADITNGAATSWNPGAPNNEVIALTLANDVLYVGGIFTSIGNQTRNRLAAIDITSASLNSWNPQVNGPSPRINALTAFNNTVYTGGNFTSVGWQPSLNFAVINSVPCVEPTLILNSGPNSGNQEICLNTPILNISYTIGGSATGAIVTGLPHGINTQISGNILTISGNPIESGTFEFIVTTTGSESPCEETSTGGSILVFEEGSVEILGEINLCAGESTTLSGDITGQFKWSTGATTPSITVTPMMSQIYGLTVTEDNTCAQTNIEVVVNQPQNEYFVVGACESFNWELNGLTYEQSGTYTYFLDCTNYELDLTILNQEEPFTINCPQNQIIHTDENCVGWIPDYSNSISLNDFCAISNGVTITQSPLPNYEISGHNNTITITVEAVDQNEISAECSFLVTLIDLWSPQITCPDNQVIISENECYALIPDYTAMVNAVDNCSSNFEISQFSGSASLTLENNSTLVTIMVEDNHGNDSTCDFTVTLDVEENISIVCPTNQLVQPNEHCEAELANYLEMALIEGTCLANPLIVQMPAAYTLSSELNMVTVTLTVTGGQGVTSECNFEVYLNTDPSLSITCPENQVVIADAYCEGVLQDYRSLSSVSTICSINPIISQVPMNFTLSEQNPSVTVTLIVEDEMGLRDDCHFLVSILDNIPPQINCPEDIEIEADDFCEVLIENYISLVEVTDNCPLDLVMISQTPEVYSLNIEHSSAIVSMIATDGHGNSSSCQFNVSLVDRIIPTIICPENQLIQPGSNCELAISNYVSQTIATDNCSEVELFQFPASFVLNSQNPEVDIQMTARDDSGNEAYCTFTVSILLEAPLAIICPEDQTVYTNEDCEASIGNYIALTSISGGCGSDPVIEQFPLNHTLTFQNNSIEVTMTALDDSGNSAGCTFTINLSDNIQPEFAECPQNITVELLPTECESIINWNIPVAMDNCEIPVIFELNGQEPGMLAGPGIFELLYQAVDLWGNTAVCSFAITVVDLEEPELVCPNDATIQTDPDECTGTPTAYSLFPLNANDNCPDFELSFTITGATITQGVEDASQTEFYLGSSTIVYLIEDNNQNTTSCSFTITVLDNEPPIIDCPNNQVRFVSLNCEYNVQGQEFDVEALDNCSIESVVFMYNGEVYQETLEGITLIDLTNIITVNAEDNSGNISTCSFVITLEDNMPPSVLNCPSNVTLITESDQCEVFLDYTTPIFTDNCSVEMVVTEGPLSGSFLSVGSYTITFTAFDNSENTASCSFSVIVQDLQGPAIVCPENLSVNTDQGFCTWTCEDTSLLPLQINENCPDYNISFFISGETQGEGQGTEINVSFAIGLSTIIYQVIDINGLSAECSFEVNVTDIVSPIITCPSDQTVYLDEGCEYIFQGVEFDALATDNCEWVSIIYNIEGDEFEGSLELLPIPVGVTSIIATAVDIYGNSGDCIFAVNVEDNLPPIALCADLTIQLNTEGFASINAQDLGAASYDNCDIANISLTQSNFSCEDVGDIDLFLLVEDNHGNSASCSFILTVEPGAEYGYISDITGNGQSISNGSSSFDPQNFTFMGSTVVGSSIVRSYNIQFTSIHCLNPVSTEIISVSVSDPSRFEIQGIEPGLYAPGNTSFTITYSAEEIPNEHSAVVSIESSTGVYSFAIKGVTNPTETPFVLTDHVSINASGGDISGAGGNMSISIGQLFFFFQTGDFYSLSDGIQQPGVIPCPLASFNEVSDLTISCTENMPIPSELSYTNSLNGLCEISGTIWGIISGEHNACGGTYVELWSYTDTYDRTIEVSRTITVLPADVPIFDEVEDIIIELHEAPPSPSLLSFSNNHACLVTGSVTSTLSGNHDECGGVYTESWSFTDDCGNVVTRSREITVVDSEPPVALCQDITLQLNNDLVILSIEDVDSGSSDNCSISNKIISKTEYSCSDVGIQAVTLTVFDDIGLSGTCVAMITVSDTYYPLAMCIANIALSLGANGMVTLDAQNVDAGSTDNCAIATLDLSKSEFTCSDIGSQMVTLTVADPSGLESTCISYVSIQDYLPPFANCQDITIGINANDQVTIVAHQIDIGSSDNCSISSFALSRSSFTCDDLGANPVTLTVTDPGGLSSSCVSTVTVAIEAGFISLVRGSGQPILNGSTNYSPVNLTLMGSAPIEGYIVRNYTVTFASPCAGNALTEITDIIITNGEHFSVGDINIGTYSNGVLPFTITYQGGLEAEENTSTVSFVTTQGVYSFNVKGVTIEPSDPPAIAEIRGNGILILNGDMTPTTVDHSDFGVRYTPGTLSRTFTLSNGGVVGSEHLEVSSIVIGGAQGASYAVSSNGCEGVSLAGGQSCNFTVIFDSEGQTGLYEGLVSVVNTDAARNPYEFAIKAEVYAPVQSVRGNNNVIANGDNTPSTTDNTNFGAVIAGQTITRSFVIKNLGLGQITFGNTPVVLSSAGNGPGHGNFAVITQPSGPLSMNQEAAFSIRFTSPGQGSFYATVTITSSAGQHTYVIQGNGPSPRMQVTGNNLDIPTGRQTVSTADYTDYGTRSLNTNLDRTFYVRNPGSLGAAASLSLSGNPRVAIVGGEGSGMFSVTTQPGTAVGVNGSSLFRIRYRPTTAGCHWAQISIANNDPARNPYTFVVRGNTAGQSCDPNYQGLYFPEWGDIAVPFKEDLTEELIVSPNPAFDAVWVQAPKAESDYVLELLSLDGRVMKMLRTYGGLEQMDIMHLAPGVYILRAQRPGVQPVKIVKL